MVCWRLRDKDKKTIHFGHKSVQVIKYESWPFQRASEHWYSPACAKGNALKLRQPALHVTNFSLRTPGKVVAVLRNISLAHLEKKGDVVNIRSSTKILNLALGNFLSFGSYKLLFWKQKSLQAANNELLIKGNAVLVPLSTKNLTQSLIAGSEWVSTSTRMYSC